MNDKNKPAPQAIADVLGLNAAPERGWQKTGGWLASAGLAIIIAVLVFNRGNEAQIH